MSFRMKPMYAVLLHGSEHMNIGLYHLYKATPDQLCRLHYSPGSIKAVKARLKVLVDHGYVQVGAVSVPHETGDRVFFSARYYYTLAPAGVKYLARLGFDIDEGWKPHNEVDKHGLYVDHTLEVGDVIISAALLSRTEPQLYLESFVHDRVWKRQPIKVGAVALIPDAYLYFRRANTLSHFPVLLEHDRGTEEQEHFKRKVTAYLTFVMQGIYREALDVDVVNIAFTTFSGEARLNEMRKWTRQVLGNAPPQAYRAFRFANLPRHIPSTVWLEPHWYYPDDQLPQALLA